MSPEARNALFLLGAVAVAGALFIASNASAKPAGAMLERGKRYRATAIFSGTDMAFGDGVKRGLEAAGNSDVRVSYGVYTTVVSWTTPPEAADIPSPVGKSLSFAGYTGRIEKIEELAQ